MGARCNPLPVLGAGEGNRTLVVSLEGFCSTIELHPPRRFPLVEGEGFEPSKAEPADLQSAPFDRSGTPPAVSTAETRDFSRTLGSRSIQLSCDRMPRAASIPSF